MRKKGFLRDILGVLILGVLVLAACGGGATNEPADTGGVLVVVEEDEVAPEGESEAAEAEPEAEAEDTPGPEALIPDVLVLHPDAYDIVTTPSSGTYIYVIPGMVAEAMEYMLTELKAKGWEELGQPTLMGHLATLTLQMGKDRLTISMQDNEISETTRIQMLLMQQ